MATGFLTMSASLAAASVAVGQLGSPSGPCTANNDVLETGVAAGPSFTMPETGTITSWSHSAIIGSGQTLTMKVFRPVPDPNLHIYRVVAHDGPKPVNSGLLNTFPVSIPVQAGDILGLNTAGGGAGCICSGAPGDTLAIRNSTNLADGEAADFVLPTGNVRLDISAVLTPSNTLTVAKTAFNKKKGTATLNLTLPNPGQLTASGNGVKAASAGAVISKSVTAGPTQLLIKAKGKKKKTLNETGKVKLNVAVTYTPTGGDAKTQSQKVKLIKR
jgi:hypothetical protein